MAIHPTVLYGPGRHIRISADPAGQVFIIERDGVFVARMDNMALLLAWLKVEGLDLTDLTED